MIKKRLEGAYKRGQEQKVLKGAVEKALGESTLTGKLTFLQGVWELHHVPSADQERPIFLNEFVNNIFRKNTVECGRAGEWLILLKTHAALVIELLVLYLNYGALSPMELDLATEILRRAGIDEHLGYAGKILSEMDATLKMGFLKRITTISEQTRQAILLAPQQLLSKKLFETFDNRGLLAGFKTVLPNLKGFDADAEKLYDLAGWMAHDLQGATLLALGDIGRTLTYSDLSNVLFEVRQQRQSDGSPF